MAPMGPAFYSLEGYFISYTTGGSPPVKCKTIPTKKGIADMGNPDCMLHPSSTAYTVGS